MFSVYAAASAFTTECAGPKSIFNRLLWLASIKRRKKAISHHCNNYFHFCILLSYSHSCADYFYIIQNLIFDIWEVISPRWWHRLFPASVPLIRSTTNNSSRVRHHWEDPRTWVWGWSTPAPQGPRQVCIRRVREVATCRFHCPSPSIMQRGPPEPSVPQWENRTQGGQPTISPTRIVSCVWEPLLWSCITGFAGQPVGFNHWKSIWQNSTTTHDKNSTN